MLQGMGRAPCPLEGVLSKQVSDTKNQKAVEGITAMLLGPVVLFCRIDHLPTSFSSLCVAHSRLSPFDVSPTVI